MQWWNDFVDWLTSTDAGPVLFSAGVLFVAVIVAGLLAAWIARGAIHGLLSRTDRQQKASAIAALVDAATEASVWNSLTPQEQVLSDRAVGQADIMVRLLPIRGAGAAANWATHQLAELKRSSATFGYQLDPAIAEFRDRLIEWQNKPGRARRIFQNDLERWRYESAAPEQSLVQEQDSWVAQQHHEKYAANGAPVEPAVVGSTGPGSPVVDRTAAADTAQTAAITPPVAAYRARAGVVDVDSTRAE
jgi:hypothetical protein